MRFCRCSHPLAQASDFFPPKLEYASSLAGRFAVFWQERKIQRPYKAIGLIVARSDLLGDESLIKRVLEKARSIGADAVIIRPQPGHRLDALAIRFTDE